MENLQIVRETPIERIRKITSKWLVGNDTDGVSAMHEIAAVLIEPDPIVLQGRLETRDTVSALPSESVSQQEKARCLDDIVTLLDELAPGWRQQNGNGIVGDLVIKAIRSLAAAARMNVAEVRLHQAHDSAFDEARMDVIGQNGNTGEHYVELAEIAIQNGGKPVVEDVPWHSAPEWANVLLAGSNRSLAWAESFEQGKRVRAQLAAPHEWIMPGDLSFVDLRGDNAWTLVATRPGYAERRDATS